MELISWQTVEKNVKICIVCSSESNCVSNIFFAFFAFAEFFELLRLWCPMAENYSTKVGNNHRYAFVSFTDRHIEVSNIGDSTSIRSKNERWQITLRFRNLISVGYDHFSPKLDHCKSIFGESFKVKTYPTLHKKSDQSNMRTILPTHLRYQVS